MVRNIKSSLNTSFQRAVEQWILKSGGDFRQFVTPSTSPTLSDRIWVMKYTWPGNLDAFYMNSCQLQISDTPGFTWGRGIYVAPLKYPRSSMMYGRVGIMGYIEAKGLRVYDATKARGLELFQHFGEVYDADNFMKSLTHFYPEAYLHDLRNNFVYNLDIDLVFFRPDQSSEYVDPVDHYWFLLSDFAATRFSSRVKECKWVVVVGEHFEPDQTDKRMYKNYLQRIRQAQFPHLIWGKNVSDASIIHRIEHAYHNDSIYLLEP